MTYRNKTYVAFDGDNDIRYYNMMKAWKQRDNSSFDFFDAHEINNSNDSSMEESIKRQLRVRMDNSKVFVLLIGDNTKYLRKFVKWEIELAIKKGIPIICVNLNDSRKKDFNCPKSLDNHLCVFIPFKSKIMQYALENWPKSYANYKHEGDSRPYYYNTSVYEQLGL